MVDRNSKLKEGKEWRLKVSVFQIHSIQPALFGLSKVSSKPELHFYWH